MLLTNVTASIDTVRYPFSNYCLTTHRTVLDWIRDFQLLPRDDASSRSNDQSSARN